MLAVPDKKLPSNSDVLRIIFGFNQGNMRGFKFSKMHCKRASSSSTLNTTCRDPNTGCIAQGEKCIYQKIKANWETFPCIRDIHAIKKMERLKMRYDANVLLKEDNVRFMEELETTFRLEVPDFKEQIMSDHVLSPQDRTKKLEVLLDYIGPEATRSQQQFSLRGQQYREEGKGRKSMKKKERKKEMPVGRGETAKKIWSRGESMRKIWNGLKLEEMELRPEMIEQEGELRKIRGMKTWLRSSFLVTVKIIQLKERMMRNLETEKKQNVLKQRKRSRR